MISVFRLLNQSFDTEQDPLPRFLAAWMALEVFVNKTFTSYERELWDEFATKLTAPLRDRYVKKINEVMQNEYKLLDRFVVVSERLSPEDADSDYNAIRPSHKRKR
jgi:hypothetical protein